jgi:hypothetical protein
MLYFITQEKMKLEKSKLNHILNNKSNKNDENESKLSKKYEYKHLYSPVCSFTMILKKTIKLVSYNIIFKFILISYIYMNSLSLY